MDILLNYNGKTETTDRYWELVVGSCHAATALREDYRQQLRQCQKDLGFKYVRFHGLFDDDMSVLRKSVLGDKFILSFTNIDNIFDFLLSINMKPFIEIGFMPDCLKTGDYTIFHYKGNITPPADKNVWAWFIREFTDHLIKRYGRDEVRSWFFEIWNEPNLGGDDGILGGRFWSGSMQDYFELYKHTCEAIKSVDGFLRVGGPATSNNAFIPELLEYCEKNGAPIDFVSTHHYPTDVVLGYGVEDSKNFTDKFSKTDRNDKQAVNKLISEYVTFKKDIWKRVDRGVLTDMAKRAAAEAKGLPLYYTEWSSLAGLASDGPFGASFIAKTILDNIGIVKGYAYWTFSDIFEESGMPSAAFHGGYGLMTLQGVPKASYRAYQLLHKLGDEMYQTVFSEGTVDVYAFKLPDSGAVQFLICNHNSLLHDIKDEKVNVKIECGKKPSPHLADIVRIDENNANALRAWQQDGSPEYIDSRQLNELLAASQLCTRQIEIKQDGENLTLQVDIPAQGIALVTVYID